MRLWPLIYLRYFGGVISSPARAQAPARSKHVVLHGARKCRQRSMALNVRASASAIAFASPTKMPARRGISAGNGSRGDKNSAVCLLSARSSRPQRMVAACIGRCKCTHEAAMSQWLLRRKFSELWRGEARTRPWGLFRRCYCGMR